MKPFRLQDAGPKLLRQPVGHAADSEGGSAGEVRRTGIRQLRCQQSRESFSRLSPLLPSKRPSLKKAPDPHQPCRELIQQFLQFGRRNPSLPVTVIEYGLQDRAERRPCRAAIATSSSFCLARICASTGIAHRTCLRVIKSQQADRLLHAGTGHVSMLAASTSCTPLVYDFCV